MISWNGLRIKNLRRRLGWSTCDLARRLGCPSNVVRDWEEKGQEVGREHRAQLEYLECQVQLNADRLGLQPLADSILAQGSRSQISDDEVLCYWDPTIFN